MRRIFSALLIINLMILSGCDGNHTPQVPAGRVVLAERIEIDSWILKVTTSGGMTGTAYGGWMIDSQGNIAVGRELESREPHYIYRYSCNRRLSETELRRVNSLVLSVKPPEWSERYINPQHPTGYADGVGVLMELTCHLRSGEVRIYTTSWYDAAIDRLPEGLFPLYEETRQLSLRALRGRENR